MKPAFRTGREQIGNGLHLPGMMRENTQRLLRGNLGKAVSSEKRGPAHPKRIAGGLSQHSAPQKHEMDLFSKNIGYFGPGVGEPV